MWLWLVLAGLLILLLCLRVGVRIALEEGSFAAWLLVGPKPVQVFPPKKKKPATAPKKAKEPKKSAPKAEKPKPTVHALCQYAKLGLSAFGALIRGLRVDLLRLYAVIHSEDAAQTAIQYGGACAAVTGILPVLDSTLRIQKKDIQIDAGFQGQGSLLLDLQITAAIGRLLAIGFVYVWKFILLQRKVKKHEQSQRNDA